MSLFSYVNPYTEKSFLLKYSGPMSDLTARGFDADTKLVGKYGKFKEHYGWCFSLNRLAQVRAYIDAFDTGADSVECLKAAYKKAAGVAPPLEVIPETTEGFKVVGIPSSWSLLEKDDEPGSSYLSFLVGVKRYVVKVNLH